MTAKGLLDLSPIRPVSDLQKRFSEIEELAHESPVRLTKNGKGAYILFEEETFQRAVEDFVEDARYEFELLEGIRRGIEDIDAGRYCSIEDAFARAEELRMGNNV